MTHDTDRTNSLLNNQDWEVLWGTHTGNVPFPWINEPWIGVDKEGVIELDGRFHIRHLMTILQSVGKKLNPPFLYGDPVFRTMGRMITDRGGNEICTTHSSDLAEFIARTMSIGRFVETSHPSVQECRITVNRDDIIATVQRGGPPCTTDVMIEAVSSLVESVLVGFNGELKAILDNMGKDAIQIREGGGPVDYVASLAVSVTRLMQSRTMEILCPFCKQHYPSKERITTIGMWIIQWTCPSGHIVNIQPGYTTVPEGTPVSGDYQFHTSEEFDEAARPRVKLVPVKSTWSCPACNHQNNYYYGLVSDPQDVCIACGQKVTPGEIRFTDKAPPSIEAEFIEQGLSEAKDINLSRRLLQAASKIVQKHCRLAFPVTEICVLEDPRPLILDIANALHTTMIGPKWWNGIPDIEGLYWAHKDMDKEYPVNELMELKAGQLFLWTARHEETKKVDWRKDFEGAMFFGPLPQPPPKEQS